MRKLLLTSIVCASSATFIEYSEKDALSYVQYARAAFCSADAIKAWSCGSICDAVALRDGTKAHYFGPGSGWAVQGYVAALPSPPGYSPVQCVAAFRGSVNLPNWMADGEMWMSPFPSAGSNDTLSCPGCLVHHGFEMAYDELRDAFHQAVRSLYCASVQITAHSLGAGVATLAAMSLRGTTDLEVPPPILFGAPRVGDVAFVKAFEALAGESSPSAWRVVHHYDPVPRLGSVDQGYVHVGREVYYTEDSSSYRVCSAETSEDPTCADSVALIRCIISPYFLDHLDYLNFTFRGKYFPSGCMQGAFEEDIMSKEDVVV